MALKEDVLKHVLDGFHIPAKPEILDQVQTLAQTPNVDPAEVGRCIAKDVGLSASILKTLNSPFYGMARTITDVTQATVLLGISSVLNLVAAIKIKESMKGDSCISLDRFWDTAHDISNAMTYIGKKVGLDIPSEHLHIVGLFHDCGLAAMTIKYSNYLEIIKEAEDNHDFSITQIEEKHYNSNHATIGYYIATSWGLPKELCNVIRQHHDTGALDHKVSHEFRTIYACLKVACNMIERLERFKDTRDWPFVESAALSSLGISQLEYEDLLEDFADLFS